MFSKLHVKVENMFIDKSKAFKFGREPYLYWKEISKVTSRPSEVLLFKGPEFALLSWENSIVWTVMGNLMKWCPTPRKWIPAVTGLGFI